jgi:hypothetical protein
LNARSYKVLIVLPQIVCQDFYALIIGSNRFENHQKDELSFSFIWKKNSSNGYANEAYGQSTLFYDNLNSIDHKEWGFK